MGADAPDVPFEREERRGRAKRVRDIGVACPLCGKGKIAENSKAFYCTRFREGCELKIWKDALVRAGGPELTQKLLAMKRSGVPIGVVHESPHRVIELVRTICETLPGCRISASCDLTKLHEKTIRGTAEEVLALLEANEKAEKGEYCLVLDMSGVALEAQEEKSAASLEAQLFEEMLSGFDLRQAALTLTERGHKRNDVYRARTNVQRFIDDLVSDYTLEEDDSDE